MSLSQRKRRTRAHVIADLGVNYAERRVLECGWTVLDKKAVRRFRTFRDRALAHTRGMTP